MVASSVRVRSCEKNVQNSQVRALLVQEVVVELALLLADLGGVDALRGWRGLGRGDFGKVEGGRICSREGQ